MDCSPPSSSVYGILQARMLEWVAIPFSRGFSQPRDQTQVSCIAGRFFTIWAPRGIRLARVGRGGTAHWQIEWLEMNPVPCHYNCKTPQKGYTLNKHAKQVKPVLCIEQPQMLSRLFLLWWGFDGALPWAEGACWRRLLVGQVLSGGLFLKKSVLNNEFILQRRLKRACSVVLQRVVSFLFLHFFWFLKIFIDSVRI